MDLGPLRYFVRSTPRSRGPGSAARSRPLGLIAVALLAMVSACQAPAPADPAQQLADSAKRISDTLRLAVVTQQDGNFTAAVGLYRKLLDDGADSVQVRLGLADSLLGTADLDGALAQYNIAATMAPRDPKPELGLGRVYLVQKKPASALASYDIALQDDPQNLVALNGKGVALDLMSRHEDAQRVYRQGLAIDPTDRDIRNNLGLSLVFSKKYQEAVTVLTTLAQDPDATPRNRQNLALALGLEGDKSNAEMVASRDLDSADVANNLRYYDYIRTGGDADAVTAQPLGPPASANP